MGRTGRRVNWSGVKLLRLGACEPVMCTGKRPVLRPVVVIGRGATAAAGWAAGPGWALQGRRVQQRLEVDNLTQR